MAIMSVNDWFAAAKQSIVMTKTISTTVVSVIPYSLLDTAGNPGAGQFSSGNTTTGVVPTDATAGFPAINTFGPGNTGYLARAQFRSSVAQSFTLYDRLYHVEKTALNGASILTSQPSFVSRLPNGDYSGLEIFVEVTSPISGAEVYVYYTNEAGVTGRVSTFSGVMTGFAKGRLVPLGLQTGDKGVQKIESIYCAAIGTGVLNIVVARRLATFDCRSTNGLDTQGWDMLGAPIVYDTSALWGVYTTDSTVSGIPTFTATIING